MNLSTKQKQTHRHREQTGGCQGGGGWEREGLGVWGYQRLTLNSQSLYIGWISYILYIGWINNKVLLYSTENYIQFPGINHNGKEYKKRMYV